jgi:hypothetical protein
MGKRDWLSAGAEWARPPGIDVTYLSTRCDTIVTCTFAPFLAYSSGGQKTFAQN